MNLFLDTSSIIKLYHPEQGTEELSAFIRENRINKIFVSQLCRPEFYSAISKKTRTQELTEEIADRLVAELFQREGIKTN